MPFVATLASLPTRIKLIVGLAIVVGALLTIGVPLSTFAPFAGRPPVLACISSWVTATATATVRVPASEVRILEDLVELQGFEPWTSCMPCRRSPS